MRILLTTLNSKYVHSSLALKYLYMAAQNCCQELEVKEFTINNSRDYIFNELVSGHYDAVCFSCYIWNIRQTAELASDLKKAAPRCRILFGGPEVSYDAEAFLEEHPYVDFLIAGEGETAFEKWCRAFNGDGSYSQVPGLFFRDAAGIFAGPTQEAAAFASIPFPYSSFPCEADKVIYYESARGCPFSCSYCMSSIDRSLRELPVERVKEELSFFLKQEVKQVKFLDRTFNWQPDRSRELFAYLMKHDNGITNFHFEICADLLDEACLELLKDARKGLFQFEIGIQSVNRQTLQAVNRRSDSKAVLQKTKMLIDLGNIHVHVDLIAGLPFEDYASFGRSFDAVYQLGADHFQLGFLKLLKGTPIWQDAASFSYVWMDRPPWQVISNRFICAEELCRLQRIEEILDLYYNRRGFSRSLPWAIRQMNEGPFVFYENFSEYYYDRGFQHRSHKKEDLYRIFYAFGQEKNLGQVFTELLLQDLEQTMNFDAVKKFKRKGWNIR